MYASKIKMEGTFITMEVVAFVKENHLVKFDLKINSVVFNLLFFFLLTILLFDYHFVL